MTTSASTDILAEGELLHQRDARGVHWLTLCSPSTFNVLGESMLEALQQALARVNADEASRALVLAARGKAFCAGHNLKEMRAHPDLSYYQQLFARCTRMMMTLRQLPVPVIARVQGVATAAGCQLVAQCDLAVASENARFGVNGIDVGLFCSTPSVPLSRSMLPKQAMEMLITGGFIDAAQAQRQGLVNRVVSADQLDAELEVLLQAIVSKPRLALAMGKRLFYEQMEMGIDAAYQLAGQTMACNMVDEVAQEGVQAFIDKREPRWRM